MAASAVAALPELTTHSGQPDPEPRPHAGLMEVILAADAVELPAAPSFYVVIPTPVPTPTPQPTPTPKPKPKPAYVDSVANAKIYARNRLGATQYACLDDIFYYESKWNPLAENPKSGAYGIPQALPGDKMAAFGIWYVNDRYGSACAAWDHIEAHGWY
jgi:hypothetical protein